MNLPGSHLFFRTNNELQEYILTQPPGTLVIVPQMRLAHQVWRRQRLKAMAAGQKAWEPVAMTTLSGWLQQLWRQLWLPVQLANRWQRLVLWLEAIEATPPEEETAADLPWAVLLDETYDLCQRYRLAAPAGPEADSPLIHWRQSVIREFSSLLREHGLITSPVMPDFLQEALGLGNLELPDQLVLVGLETPAPVEQDWLAAVAYRMPVTQVHLTGRRDEEITLKGIALPDRRQEMDWVAAQVLELANQGVPLHQIAVTAPNLESYLPDLRRIWQELLGLANTENGGSYNISLGPTLAETQLFQAALLPLKFILGGEQRLDLIGWLRSSYYGAFGQYDKTFLLWDVVWRQNGLAYGWISLRELILKNSNDSNPLHLIEQALSLLPRDQATAGEWSSRLLEIWRLLKFPHHTSPDEARQWQAIQNLLAEFALAGGDRSWTPGVLVEWLSWGAARLDLAGEGAVDAGIQIQGLLELRGLDFDTIFCLGLNMGVFPPPPRPLPLLTSREKAHVLGGDYQSQEEFARTSFRYLTAAALNLVLTRPCIDHEEDQIASYLLPPNIWPRKEEFVFNPLSRPHPAWLRSAAVQAAFLVQGSGLPVDLPERIKIPLPEQVSLIALEKALTCPCWFYLSNLLGLEELPEPEPGLTPLERGTVIHEVLQRFTSSFLPTLQQDNVWDDQEAWRQLQGVIGTYQPRGQENLHWQAEFGRWLTEPGGVLREWLQQEKQRFSEGWRWLLMEEEFTGLQLPGWPMPVRGRLDRIDAHSTAGLMLWDYKTGALLKQTEIEEDRSRFQLLGYLLAVRQGLTNADPSREIRAGIIGLKSSRKDHLKFEEFKLTAADWQKILESKLLLISEIGQRVGQGDFHPESIRDTSCQLCPFGIMCGYHPVAAAEEAE